jgi:ABC-2 type transport system permease protein
LTALRAAWTVEALKLRRSVLARVVTPLLTVVVPLASIGSVALARLPDLPGTAAAKFGPYATGPLAVAHLEVCGQILSVAVLLAGGFGAAWSFGREFTEGTAGALFGLAVPRSSIALAKGLVLSCWLAGCVAVSVTVTVALSALVGGDVVAAAATAGVALGAGTLAVGLATPFGWVATRLRNALGTVGVLIGVVAVTQIVVVLGAGAWFPYAIPSLWAGAGGRDAAAGITLAALCWAAAVAPLGLLLVRSAWARLTDV